MNIGLWTLLSILSSYNVTMLITIKASGLGFHDTQSALDSVQPYSIGRSLCFRPYLAKRYGDDQKR